jgi:hypothetical protein
MAIRWLLASAHMAERSVAQALWTFHNDPEAAHFLTEFIALANHRKSIRTELANHAERCRAIEIEAIERADAQGRIDLRGVSPAAVHVLSAICSRGLVNEATIGMHTGHEEFADLVDQLLTYAEEAPSS